MGRSDSNQEGPEALAAAIALRTGGDVVDAHVPSSEPKDVLLGRQWDVSRHGGRAKFGVLIGVDDHQVVSDDWSIWFEGEVRREGDGNTSVLVISRYPEPRELALGSGSHRCVAIIAAYNEGDVIASVVSHIVSQGVLVYLIDNWSTDDTWAIAQDLQSEGMLIGLERFPEEPSGYHDWDVMLTRKAEIAVEVDADWAIHNDADEVRFSPWSDLTFGEGLAVADALGYNAVDFTVVEHPPTNESFTKGMDVVASFPHYRFGLRRGHFRQIKAWKPQGVVATMDSGHDVRIPNRRVFPFNFLVRHYPIRSQSHGMQKVFHERVPRWNPELKARGWHRQYDHVDKSTEFTAESSQLPIFNKETFAHDHLGELLARVGLEPEDWATPPKV